MDELSFFFLLNIDVFGNIVFIFDLVWGFIKWIVLFFFSLKVKVGCFLIFIINWFVLVVFILFLEYWIDIFEKFGFVVVYILLVFWKFRILLFEFLNIYWLFLKFIFNIFFWNIILILLFVYFIFLINVYCL